MASLKSNRKGFGIFLIIGIIALILIGAVLVTNPDILSGGDGETDTTEEEGPTETIDTEQQTCEEDDGGDNPYVAGTVIICGPPAPGAKRICASYPDKCNSERELVEQFCEGDRLAQIPPHTCASDEICIENEDGLGACVPVQPGGEVSIEDTCIDTDDSQPDDLKLGTFGIVYGRQDRAYMSVPDTCLDENTIIEQTCVETELVPREETCPNGTICQNGECIDSNDPPELLECEDGTLQLRCSETRPFICELNIGLEGMTAVLNERCSICWCPDGQVCNFGTEECYTAYCGDGYCLGDEDAESCEVDCTECPDTHCTGDETSLTCPEDCGEPECSDPHGAEGATRCRDSEILLCHTEVWEVDSEVECCDDNDCDAGYDCVDYDCTCGTEGLERCTGEQIQVCTDGEWVIDRDVECCNNNDCDENDVCADHECICETEGATRCTDNQILTCTDGEWAAENVECCVNEDCEDENYECIENECKWEIECGDGECEGPEDIENCPADCLVT